MEERLNVVNNKRVNDTIDFTNDQKLAVNGIIDFIALDFDPAKYIIGLTGAGGTGKTFITKYIIRNCKYSDSVIKCTSPTHKACRVFSYAIGGKKVETIQSTFGFRLDLKLEDFDPDNPQFNPKSKPKLDNCKLLIIDESSMLPAKLVTYICDTCKTLNIKILFIGDASQLPPVNDKESIAFKRCYKLYKLNEVVRQETNNPVKGLLDILRQDIADNTLNFINYLSRNVGKSDFNENNEGYYIVNTNKFTKLIELSFHDEEFVDNIDMYRIIAYTNVRVASWNNFVRNSIIIDSDKAILTKNDLILSNETIVDDFLSTIIINSEEYIVKDIVSYVDSKYGFKGFLAKFQMIHGGHISQPLFVIDSKDKFSILKYVQVLDELSDSARKASGGTRVAKWKSFFDFKKKYLLLSNILDKYGNIKIQSSISYGFAITSHKSQGSTYDNVFVDANDMIYDKNGKLYAKTNEILRRLYVACSRARKQLVICYG